MKSNYKPIGDYIRLVDERNRDLKVSTLLGLSVNKEFIPSVANTVGTDMANYKIIKKNQFACSLMQVRRDKKIPVAILSEFDEAIISQAYPVFEIIDEEKILPEYLMMWFSRSEFDRESCFYAVGGVRGSLEWEDFCNMQLPVPSIEKQKAIVKEYNTIVNRIKLNEELNKKLEETAQAIYKQWFVDFEFPNKDGKPYKSSGGRMVWNDELGKEIPEGWEVGALEHIMTFKNGKKKPDSEGDIPIYGGNGVLGYTDKFNDEDIIAVGRVGAYCGSLFRVFGKCWISDNAISAKSKSNFNMFCFYTLKVLNLNERSEGTGQPLLTQNILNRIRCVIPENRIMSKYEIMSELLFKKLIVDNKEAITLSNLKSILLSKMAKG